MPRGADLAAFVAAVGAPLLVPLLALVVLFSVILAVRDGMSRR